MAYIFYCNIFYAIVQVAERQIVSHSAECDLLFVSQKRRQNHGARGGKSPDIKSKFTLFLGKEIQSNSTYKVG